MAEEGVIVDQNAAMDLAQYLTEIGRLGNNTAREVGAAIQSGVNSQWGTAKVPQFRDSDGIGWVVEVSDRFNGEVLYAIVRSKEGKRHVTEVVDEEKVKVMFPQHPSKPGQPKQAEALDAATPASAQTSDPNETLIQELALLRAKVEEHEQRNTQLNAKLSLAMDGDQNGPALVRWKQAVKSDDGQGFESDEDRVTIGEVGGEIERLIGIGVKAEYIEVWTRRKVPKVRFDLE